MSGVHIAPPEQQPASFAFTAENLELAKKHIAKYPAGRQQSAVMPLLDIAQRQHDNWVPQAAIRHIAELLGMAPIRVLEVASFYTMYNLAPVGKHFIQVCTTTPCWLAGSDKVVSACKKHLGLNPGETSADGQFTVIEVECLGACVNAPMLQLGDDFYEDLTEESTGKILEALKRGEILKPGPQSGRLSSEPHGGATTLTTFNPAGAAGGNDD
ncbi:NADH-quinone oxidoreductase subunit NuoE [Ferrovibrio terrae]|jgi:NADH-quinone oxidoreductase E subunit|uniref:NADH-quinone oxidoreductase subunit NuoE n=1 Tax=Ferrovibrio terrae TaxID=2594003 RepID=UPI0031382C46